ncbi:MAG: asparagine synthetase B, partial [Oscillospiraceae bacterium]
MCAIAGVIDFEGILQHHKDWCVEAKKQLKNRGPDQDDMLFGDIYAFSHTRLAVIDVENGRQPMIFSRGNEEYIIVYNGELYNTDEIRNELIDLGYGFQGHSDTEVVLKAYSQWKDDCIKKFNGIFAFSIWENHNQRLFIARDRIGVKPFFYTI